MRDLVGYILSTMKNHVENRDTVYAVIPDRDEVVYAGIRGERDILIGDALLVFTVITMKAKYEYVETYDNLPDNLFWKVADNKITLEDVVKLREEYKPKRVEFRVSTLGGI